MHSRGRREHSSRVDGIQEGTRGRGRPAGRMRRLALCTALVALASAGTGALATGASAAEESAVSFPGGPLTVSVGPLGQCQSSYANHGNNYFPPTGNVGDCGFFLAFPSTGTGQPTALKEKTFGFEGTAGPRLPTVYTAVPPQSPVTGSGTTANPYTQTTVFNVETEAPKTIYATITEVTTYVNGEPQFTSTYTVKNNLKGKTNKIYFRAIYAGDLFVNGDDFGTGQFLGGPPRFIGGLNPGSGVLGGFLEAGAPALPWSAFQEGCWNETPESRCEGASPTDNGIWHVLRTSVEAPTAFNNTIEPALVDNAAGVEWDQLRTTGLEGEAAQSFTVINRTQVPSTLQISPTSQTLTQGQTETINVTALDLANQPYAGKVLHYTVSGANPQAGTVTLNSGGSAQISYVGQNAGTDTTQLFVDLVGSGVKTAGDPAGTASVTFLPKPPPPTPNSTYKIQSIHVNADGTITIVFVPTQSGVATLEVTVPTGTISRSDASAAKKKKCKKGQIKIKGKCRPKTTLAGRVSAAGVGGVPLKLTVKSSSKVKRALKKRRTVHLTATLSYKSALGGAPTVQVFHFTVKPKKKKHHH
ncbi:MAG: hypothetical protein JWL67_198 [Solirubrobacterales bacterium]|nr:hypothetical protein [Solirubrobacterales bacterium]